MAIIQSSNNDFSIEQAMEILSKNSPTDFCVEFDFLWVWCGYLNKANAKRQLDKFVEGKDFSSSMMKTSNGRPSKRFLLTTRCAKIVVMDMEKTANNKRKRRRVCLILQFLKKLKKKFRSKCKHPLCIFGFARIRWRFIHRSFFFKGKSTCLHRTTFLDSGSR